MNLQASKIFLIGMPGSGKSTLGKQLADHLGLLFIDLDDEIEEEAGRSIKEIFADQGEPYFRKLEHEVLLKVAKLDRRSVVATGGGTPCFFDNLQIIKKAGKSIFIDPPPGELLDRMLAKEVEKRPKFSGAEPKDVLSRLLEERLKYYQQAEYRWGGAGTIQELARHIGE